MTEILLATHNIHKRDELAAMLADHFQVEILPEDFPDIEETGKTLQENARIKAKAVHNAFGKATVADDTGLEVAALGGAPGVYTARYAGPTATYSDNCKKLLNALQGVSDRRATFRTIICYMAPDGTEMNFEGKVEGTISLEEKGSAGFGYDPVFMPDETPGRTFAELTPQEKNSLSHRGRAITAFVQWCKSSKNGT